MQVKSGLVRGGGGSLERDNKAVIGKERGHGPFDTYSFVILCRCPIQKLKGPLNVVMMGSQWSIIISSFLITDKVVFYYLSASEICPD